MTVDPKLQRHLTTARRELTRAVARFAAIDPLPGHTAEATRLAREVRDAASGLLRTMEDNLTGDDDGR